VKVPVRVRFALSALSNVHRQGPEQNILLFATPRGGSTWVMEILASQPGVKYFDEPFNIRRANVAHTKLFSGWEDLMPETNSTDALVGYINDLAANRYPHMNPPPFRPLHRFRTNRIVFKIHELEHLVGTLATRCNAQVVYLLRHPVPTTLSRVVFPRLEMFLGSPYYRGIIGDERTLREIERIVANGSHLERGIVSWCYENLVPLRHRDFDGLFVTYEELVVNPVRSCDLLLERLRFRHREAMLAAFDQPAANIEMSKTVTRSTFADPDGRKRRTYLVTKWLQRVTSAECAAVSSILQLFGIETYTADDPMPQQHLHFGDTRQMLDNFAASTR
jgi:Sulfotransferase family